jgi:hypothetical protein
MELNFFLPNFSSMHLSKISSIDAVPITNGKFYEEIFVNFLIKSTNYSHVGIKFAVFVIVRMLGKKNCLL